MLKDAMNVVTEAQLQNTVMGIARSLGWMIYHTYDSRRSHPGFPDLVLVRPPRVIFAELKKENGRLTKGKLRVATGQYITGQLDWINALSLCPVETFIWRPSDLDTIGEILK